MSDHGRIIPLNGEPNDSERYIEVYAGPGHAVESDEPTLKEEVHQHLRWIEERSREHTVAIRKRVNLKVAGLRGQRVIVRYYDKKLARWYVEDFIELLKEGLAYSLYLRTGEKEYNHDRDVFDTVVASFSLLGRDSSSGKTQN